MNNEKLIIKCPDCETKFNLKADSLAGVKDPKFHCSKCDNIFEVRNIDTDEHELDETDSFKSDKLDSNSEFDNSEFDENDFRKPKSTQDDFTSSFRNKKTENLNISKTSSLLDSSSKNTSNKTNSLLDKDFLNSFPDASEEDIILDKTKSKEENNELENDELENDMQHYQSEQLELDDYYKKRAEEMHSRYDSPDIKGETFCKKLNFKNTISIFSPLLVLLTILAIFSFFLSQNAEYSTKLMSGIIGKTPKVAPVKVIMINRKLKKIVLDSGEKVVLVSGMIINDTNDIFSEVIIEALAYDENGMKLKSQKAYLNSSLIRTRISALNPRMIHTLQKRRPIKKLNLTPGTRMNFVVALLDDLNDAELISKITSYNTRVYSVM